MPARLTWDNTGEKKFEAGTDHGVLYTIDSSGQYEDGVAWNGLTGVTESNTGGEETALWADNIKYASLRSAEEFGGTIEAYMCPREFYQCDGSDELATGVYIGQQSRKSFGLSYRTKIGNDVMGTDYGYKLHLVYGASVSPTEKAYTTINESPEGISLSWEFATTPVPVTGKKPTAHLIIDSTEIDSAKLEDIEDILYGSSSANARLPLPDEIITIMGS